MSMKKFTSSEHHDGNDSSVFPSGTLTWTNTGGLKLHDGSTAGGVAVGGIAVDGDGKLTVPGEIWAKAGDSFNGITFSPDGSTVYTTIKVDTGANMVLNNYQNIYIKRSGAERINITDTAITLKSQDSTKSWALREDGKLQLPAGGDIVASDGVTSVLGGGDGVKYTSILDARSGDFTVATEQLVLVYNNGDNRTITLPATPTVGQTVTIKKTIPFGQTVTVNGNGHNIDGGSSITITSAYGYVTVVYATDISNGSQWWITAASL